LVFPRAQEPIRVVPAVLIRAWPLASALIQVWPQAWFPPLARASPLVLVLPSA
jgi:hypothetical protein